MDSTSPNQSQISLVYRLFIACLSRMKWLKDNHLHISKATYYESKHIYGMDNKNAIA
jgi:hypothetical protein